MYHDKTRLCAGTESITGANNETEALSQTARNVARGLRRPSVPPALIGLIAAGLDLIAVALAFWFTRSDTTDPRTGIAIAIIAALATVGTVHLAKGYRLAALRRFLPGLALLLLAGGGISLVIGMIGGAWVTLPRIAITLLICAFPARGLAHLLAVWARDFGLTERRAVIVGGGLEATRLIEGLAANPDNDIRICGLFDDRDNDRSPPIVTGVPKLGSTRALLDFARTAEIDMLIMALPLSAEQRIRQILDPLRVLPLDVRLSAYSADMEFRRRDPRTGDGGTALLSLISRPLNRGDDMLKRTFDLFGAGLALLILALPMALVALAIRLDSPGPVFFRQPRHGFNHRPIDVWKFRSMHSNQCDVAARKIVTRDDPRVTRVGRFIRKYSIDELPQLYNVLRGELSLVGPRPHALVALSTQQVAFAEIVDGYAARHRMRPGITGWAQINGWRGEIDNPEKLRKRFEHDLYYIENWSLWLDLRILALTPIRILDTTSAY